MGTDAIATETRGVVAARTTAGVVVVLAAGSSVRSAERTRSTTPVTASRKTAGASHRAPRVAVYQPETVHTSWFSRAASAAAAARQSRSSPSRKAYITEREALTSALAGPLVNARAMSAGVAPCAPTPGRSRIACGSSRRASPTARGCVAPTTAPTDESPHSPTSSSPELADELGHLVPERAAVGEGEILDVGRAGVRGLDQAEDPAAAPAAGGDERLERVAAEIRVDGERVGEPVTPLARLEIGVGVRARGGADVAALAVDDHEQPGRAGVADDALEGGEAVGAEHLEERELRLDGDCVRRDRVDDPAAEARGRLGRGRPAHVRVAAQLEREQVEARIEPDDQLAVPLDDGLGEAVGERRRGDGGALHPYEVRHNKGRSLPQKRQGAALV